MERILVIQTASIGDVILATPVLESLHKEYPQARIDMVLKKGTESLFIGHPFLGKVFIWDKSEKKLRNFYIILKEVQNEHYDLVVNIQRYFLTGLLTAFSRAKKTSGFDKNPFSLFFSKRIRHEIASGQYHETDRNIKLIEGFVREMSNQPRLYPSKQDNALVSQYKTHRYICIAPASLWYTKQYPVAKWIGLMRQLPPELYVYFLGSPADRQLCESIISESGHANTLNLAGRLKLLETAALQRDAVMNFVNDSAPMHLASSVNAAVTAVFCSTVPEFGFGPLSDDAAIVQTAKELECRPCGLHGKRQCPERHFECAKSIETEQLLNRIR